MALTFVKYRYWLVAWIIVYTFCLICWYTKDIKQIVHFWGSCPLFEKFLIRDNGKRIIGGLLLDFSPLILKTPRLSFNQDPNEFSDVFKAYVHYFWIWSNTSFCKPFLCTSFRNTVTIGVSSYIIHWEHTGTHHSKTRVRFHSNGSEWRKYPNVSLKQEKCYAFNFG